MVFAEYRIISGSLWSFRLGIFELKLNLSPFFLCQISPSLKSFVFTNGSYDYRLEEITVQLHAENSVFTDIFFFLQIYSYESLNEEPYCFRYIENMVLYSLLYVLDSNIIQKLL